MTGLAGTAGVEPGIVKAPASARAENVWRWLRWTRWPISVPIFWLAVATVVVDVVTAWVDVDLGAARPRARVACAPARDRGSRS